jgi:hypothetical protein
MAIQAVPSLCVEALDPAKSGPHFAISSMNSRELRGGLQLIETCEAPFAKQFLLTAMRRQISLIEESIGDIDSQEWRS